MFSCQNSDKKIGDPWYVMSCFTFNVSIQRVIFFSLSLSPNQLINSFGGAKNRTPYPGNISSLFFRQPGHLIMESFALGFPLQCSCNLGWREGSMPIQYGIAVQGIYGWVHITPMFSLIFPLQMNRLQAKSLQRFSEMQIVQSSLIRWFAGESKAWVYFENGWLWNCC